MSTLGDDESDRGHARSTIASRPEDPPDPRGAPTPAPDFTPEDVLVLTFRKGFWASPECEVFPRRVYGAIVRGHSTGWLNTGLLAGKALAALIRFRPRLLVFGSAHRLVPFYLVLRRLRVLRVPAIVTNQVYFGPRYAPFADRVIVYSRREAEAQPNYVYVPIPADGAFDEVVPHEAPEPYVFSGGGTLRDFGSLIEAVRSTEINLTIVTHSPESLGWSGSLPPNCTVHWRMPLEEFLSLAAGSHVVAVPLYAGATPHGHTTIAQALCLGKPVVTTRGASVEDYVRDGEEGLLVGDGDVDGYRTALRALLSDDDLRRRCEQRARARAPEFSYGAFARSLTALCDEVLAEQARSRCQTP